MALFTKCILKEPKPSDGIRISIMSRHTLSDGITPDPKIQSFDIHMPALGPSPKLVGDYYKRNLPWTDFEKRYISEMNEGSKIVLTTWLSRLALEHDVTLLCIEETCENCHRRLLADTYKAQVPDLRVEHC